MLLNYKLFFKYILFYQNQIFFKNKIKNEKNIFLFLNKNQLYYLSLHLKLSSLFYSTQLVDLFAYDSPSNTKGLSFDRLDDVRHKNVANSIVVYNFHNLMSQERFFLFTNHSDQLNIKKNKKLSNLKSITELYPNAWWLEREAAELNNVVFTGKKDTRNLMLIYGDTSAPFKKEYPCVGLKEVFYDAITDQVAYNPISLQF